MLYWVMAVLVAAAAGLGLFFYLLQNQIFGPAARAKQRAKLAEQKAARAARIAAATGRPVENPAE